MSPPEYLSPMQQASSTNKVAHDKSLQRSGGQWYLVRKQLAVFDKVPMISLGEPPGAELSRYVSWEGALL